ncbi:MAG: hypothetical protein FWF10_03105 [Clostridiales bacterium]|nr:hypothetical protein [Clostridiales bacterium]
MADLMHTKIKELEFNYLSVLKKAESNIYSANAVAIIDEILVFWERNRRLVECILRHDIIPYDTYIFAAATYMDMNDYEHYPFVTLGKKHIMDDRLCSYIKIINGDCDSNDYSKKLHNLLLTVIQDNIKIIENCFPSILILPVRFLADIEKDAIHKGTEVAFLNMFTSINSMKEFFRLKDIIEIEKALLPTIPNSLIFSADEDMSNSFISRFREYQKTIDYSMVSKDDETGLFFTAIYGYFSQALDIIMLCASYALIPYIRYDVAFKYMLSLSSNFTDDEKIRLIVFRACIAFSLYRIYDTHDFCNIEFSKYVEAVIKYDFSGKLLSDINERNFFLSNASVEEVHEMIEKHLALLKLSIDNA